MSLSRDSRDERKLKAILRAQRALDERLARIDWEEEVLIPKVNALKAGEVTLELPESHIVEIEDDSGAAATDNAS